MDSDDKILPMSDREEKIFNYREQVEEMRRKIKALEEENRMLQMKFTKDGLQGKTVEVERKGSFIRNLPWKNERPKTSIYPPQQNKELEAPDPSKQSNGNKSQLRQLQDENFKLSSERDSLATRLRQCENELHSVKEEKRIATDSISKLSKEKDDLHKRLCGIVSDRLRHENTDIADISNEHRPTKLREKMAEIYNYQWTDALDELQEKNYKDGDPTQLLLKILMEAHSACKEVTWNRLFKLTEECSSVRLPWQLEYEGEENGMISKVDLTVDQKSQIKQICFDTLNGLESKIRTMLLKRVEFKINFQAEEMKNTRKYLEDCIDLCWRMSLQEKPMHLDTNVEVENGQQHFDNEKFRSYTNTGQYVDFVVWPALYLFEGGPLLERGIAQGL